MPYERTGSNSESNEGNQSAPWMSAVADAAATGMPLFMPAPDPSHTATGKAAFSKATMRHSVVLEEHSRLNSHTHQQQHQSSHQSFSATPVGRPLIHQHSLALSCCIVLPNMLINLCCSFPITVTQSLLHAGLESTSLGASFGECAH